MPGRHSPGANGRHPPRVRRHAAHLRHAVARAAIPPHGCRWRSTGRSSGRTTARTRRWGRTGNVLQAQGKGLINVKIIRNTAMTPQCTVRHDFTGQAVLRCKTGHITKPNGPFRTVKRPVRRSKTQKASSQNRLCNDFSAHHRRFRPTPSEVQYTKRRDKNTPRKNAMQVNICMQTRASRPNKVKTS